LCQTISRFRARNLSFSDQLAHVNRWSPAPLAACYLRPCLTAFLPALAADPPFRYFYAAFAHPTALQQTLSCSRLGNWHSVPSRSEPAVFNRKSHLTQRAYHRRIAIALIALAVVLLSAIQDVCAQDMPGGGGIPSLPKSMFGKKQDDRSISGPSLTATEETVADIRVTGNSTIPTSQILNQLQTRIGRPFDPALVQSDIRKLAARGWFVDIQPRYEQSPKGRVVIFKVVERPVVRYVEYIGNIGIRTKKLEKETDLKVDGPVDPYAVQEARRRLVDLYHRSGYNNVQINVLEGDKPTDHGIVFVINEGSAQKIWKVEFVGNEFISSGRLKTKIESKPPTLYIFKGFVDRDLIDGDVNRLTAYYRAFGYFDAKIGRQLVFDENNKWLTLRFVIHEGIRYQVESVAFIGNKLFSSESLTTGVELKPDSNSGPVLEQAYHKVKPLPPGPRPFEQDKMNADVAWLKELYGSQGYVFADIKAEPTFLEQPGRVRLMYKIEEGRRWRVGNVFVHINGDNPHTKIQTALNRLSIRSGQIADIREIRASERRLQASGLFLTDPVHGVAPKITYHIPELGKTQMAQGTNGYRGQSPDIGGISLQLDADLPTVPVQETNPGAPLIAPPTAAVAGQPQFQQTYKVETASAEVPADEQLDVHLYFDSDDENSSPRSVYALPAASESEPRAASPTAKRYEARRPPYDDVASAPQNASGYSTSSYPALTAHPANSTSAYSNLVVRTQSPYQPPSAQPPSTQSYTNPSYGGQSVGATGPDTVPTGASPYSVRQVAITEPQLPPNGSPSPAVIAPQAAPSFGPPPMNAGPLEQLPGQPPGPVPMYNAPPVYGAPPRLAPDTSITPVPNAPYPTEPFAPMMQDPAVDMDVVLSEAQTGRLMLGVAVNSDAGLVGQILLDEQNFDLFRYPTSWQDIVDGRAWRGGGERFRVEAAPGTQVQRYLVSFQEPYIFDSPYTLGLSGSYFTRRYRDWDEQRVGGRTQLGYQWVENDLSTSIAYRGEDVEVSNPSVNIPNGLPGAIPELNAVLGHNAVHGFSWSVANDTRDSAFLATEGHFLQLTLEEVLGSFQYPRAIIDARQYFLLDERPDHSGRHVLTLSSRAGFSGDDTPVYDRFFAGGFSSLRGFEFRGASPVAAANPNVKVGGEFEFINTVEYLFPLTADDTIHGVTFVDFGTVEPSAEFKEFRVAPGLGLRITVPAMGPAPIALDFAFPIRKKDTDDTQVFSFNVGLQR
jgi:outer membrane protein insertion porin family